VRFYRGFADGCGLSTTSEAATAKSSPCRGRPSFDDAEAQQSAAGECLQHGAPHSNLLLRVALTGPAVAREARFLAEEENGGQCEAALLSSFFFFEAFGASDASAANSLKSSIPYSFLPTLSAPRCTTLTLICCAFSCPV
jgi:hypothetical protein